MKKKKKFIKSPSAHLIFRRITRTSHTVTRRKNESDECLSLVASQITRQTTKLARTLHLDQVQSSSTPYARTPLYSNRTARLMCTNACVCECVRASFPARLRSFTKPDLSRHFSVFPRVSFPRKVAGNERRDDGA